jgi:DNA-binding NarL/FixJ family response regulator
LEDRIPVEKIRVLLIEDNRLLRESITTILHAQPDFQVIARPESCDTLHKLKKPDVALLNFRLPIQNSLDLMVLIKKEFSETKVIAMNVLPDEVDIIEIVKAGGSGFILRDASTFNFINTIRKVIKGEKVLPPLLTNSLFSQIVNNAPIQLTSMFKRLYN